MPTHVIRCENIVKRKNPTTGIVHIVREQYKYRIAKGCCSYRNVMYCGLQDNGNKLRWASGYFPMTDAQPTCRNCIKSFIVLAKKDIEAQRRISRVVQDRINETKTKKHEIRYILATIGSGNQDIVVEVDVSGNRLEFNSLQDALDERSEMAPSAAESIIIVKEAREVLDV